MFCFALVTSLAGCYSLAWFAGEQELPAEPGQLQSCCRRRHEAFSLYETFFCFFSCRQFLSCCADVKHRASREDGQLIEGTEHTSAHLGCPEPPQYPPAPVSQKHGSIIGDEVALWGRRTSKMQEGPQQRDGRVSVPLRLQEIITAPHSAKLCPKTGWAGLSGCPCPPRCAFSSNAAERKRWCLQPVPQQPPQTAFQSRLAGQRRKSTRFPHPQSRGRWASSAHASGGEWGANVSGCCSRGKQRQVLAGPWGPGLSQLVWVLEVRRGWHGGFLHSCSSSAALNVGQAPPLEEAPLCRTRGGFKLLCCPAEKEEPRETQGPGPVQVFPGTRSGWESRRSLLPFCSCIRGVPGRQPKAGPGRAHRRRQEMVKRPRRTGTGRREDRAARSLSTPRSRDLLTSGPLRQEAWTVAEGLRSPALCPGAAQAPRGGGSSQQWALGGGPRGRTA